MTASDHTIPPAAHGLPRPRIDALLREACGHPLVTITAGTGYGKTYAVRCFLESPEISHIWLQLTSMDNHPTRFWDIYTHAMRAKSPDLANLMASMGFPDSLEKTYHFLHELARAIYTKEQCVFVLDDFHKIEDASIIQFIETLVFANLENLTVILISRYPLSLSYSSLYDNGLLAHLSVADLRFTAQETEAYLQSVGLSFSDAILSNIQASTEGWPLALYLIALHRQNDGTLFDDPIECTIPLLYSLIEIEIFSRYPDEVREQFIKLALLETVPLELVKQLCGEHFTAMSHYLRENEFTYYSAQSGQYFFHRLFKRYLSSKKEALTKQQRYTIWLTAGDWCVANGRSIEALTYYRLCKNWPGIWAVVRMYGQGGYSIEQADLCLALCESFPPEFKEAEPLVRVFRGHLLLHIGEIERAHQHFLFIINEFESLTPTPARQRVLGEAYIGLAHTSIFRGDLAFADHYLTADALLPGGSSLITKQWEYVGNHHAVVLFDPAPGSLDRIIDLLFKVRPAASRVMNGCGYGVEYLAAAEAEFFRGRLGTATEYAYQALYRGQEYEQRDIVCSCYFLLMRICFASGDHSKSVQHLSALTAYVKNCHGHYVHGMGDLAEAWFHIMLGSPDRTASWVLAGKLEPQAQASVDQGHDRIIYAQYLLAKGQYFEMLDQLNKMEPFFQSTKAFFSVLKTKALRSICYLHLNDEARAIEAFLEAYALAYGNGLTSHFVECGAAMAQLIGLVLAAAPAGVDQVFLSALRLQCSTYAKKLASFGGEYTRLFGDTQRKRPALTPRETEVLSLLCRGQTREEIGRHLGITVNTVKTLLKNIFSKLGALNRADAVRIAVDQGLLL